MKDRVRGILTRPAWVAGLLWLGSADLPLGAQAVFKAGIDLVTCGVVVLDKRGSQVTDLQLSDFSVWEDGKPQAISYFARGDSDASAPPLHLGLVFDTSESMGEDLKFARTAAIKFLNTLRDAVDITFVDFDEEVRAARFAQADFPRLIERIRRRAAKGWTVLYDALGVYLDAAGSQDGRKILVLYTDGGDTRSVLSLNDCLALLKASDVTLYAIGFLEHQSPSVRMDQQLKLRQLAEVTGGQAFFPTSVEELDEVYDKVEADVRAQYSFGYVSTNERRDGRWRKVQIKVTRADLKNAKIRARQGYFAQYADRAAPASIPRSPR